MKSSWAVYQEKMETVEIIRRWGLRLMMSRFGWLREQGERLCDYAEQRELEIIVAAWGKGDLL